MTKRQYSMIITLMMAIYFGAPLTAFQLDEPPVEADVPVTYTYHVPFPESSFSGQWKFRLELLPLGVDPVNMSIAAYDLRDSKIALGTSEYVLTGPLVPTLSLAKGAGKAAAEEVAIQSLVVTSDGPLTGTLWMINDAVGLLNGVAIEKEQGTRLLLPHLPNDAFNWRSTFAVQGVSDTNATGSVIFGFYDLARQYSEMNIWAGLQDKDYLVGTPYHDIFLEDDTVLWGSLRSDDPELMLSGYQTFFHNDFSEIKNIQSCAIELMTGGSDTGHVGFSTPDGWDLQDWFTFTNPNDEAVQLDFILRIRPPAPVIEGDDGEELPVGGLEPLPIQQVEGSLVLNKHDRRNFNLAMIFGELPGEAISLTYMAREILPDTTEPPVEGEEPILPESREILALHLQSNTAATALGGHMFAPVAGQESSTLLDLSPDFETVIEVYNVSAAELPATITLSDNQGSVLLEKPFLVEANGVHVIDSEELRIQVMADYETLDPESLLRMDIIRGEAAGLFFTKATAYRDAVDFGIVNPHVIYTPPVPPDFSPEEPSEP
jgi:hypothetical protein